MKTEDKMKFDNFLSHIGLRIDNKLTMKEVKLLNTSSSSQTEDYHIFQFFTHLAANDRRVIQKLFASGTYQHKAQNDFTHFSKRDILFAIFQSCDTLLLQDVISKLHTVGKAVPMLMSSVDSSDVNFLKFGLEPCFQYRAHLDSKPALSTYDFISVSAFRFGDLDFSKSDVLNKVLAELQNDEESNRYTSYLEDPELTVWSKGTLEVTWHTSNRKHCTPWAPSFLLLNLRGDGLKYTRQRSFCTSISMIQIIFLSRHSDEVLKELYTVIETSLVIVMTESTEREEIRTFSEDQMTVIYCNGLSIQEKSKLLLHSLVEKLKKADRRLKCSMSDIIDASRRLSFIDDEQQFHKAKRLANEVDHYITSNFIDCKERMFLLTKACKKFGSIKDLIVSNTTCEKNLRELPDAPFPQLLETLLQFFTFDNNEQQVFLRYLHYCLAQRCWKQIQQYMDVYKVHLGFGTETELWNKLRLDGDEACASEESLLKVMNENILTVEHFLRALWQLLRSSHPKIKNCFDKNSYSECIKTWLLNGNSIDVINFDSCHIPSAWTHTVLGVLQSLQDDVSVRVVSAMSGNGTHSYRLLNDMFGANFNEIENIYPGGIRMQLLPLKNTAKSSLGFDYLLLLNIKMVSLVETIRQSYSEMRGFLLSVMSSVTDVMLVDLDKDDFEDSITFDMIVHSVLKNTCSVLENCCFIYRVMNTDSTSLADLRAYTLKRMKESCCKIEESKINSSTKTDTERKLFKRLQDNISVNKLTKLPTSFSSNQEYVKGLYDLKEFILQLLQRCRRKARNFAQIGKEISSQSEKILKEIDPSLSPRFFRFINPSIKVRGYLWDNLEKIKQKISLELVTASKAIVTADVIQKAENHTISEIQKLIFGEIKKLRMFLTSFEQDHKSLSDECTAINAQLLAEEKELIRRLPKELEKAVKEARERLEIDHIIKIKVKELLFEIMTGHEHMNGSSSETFIKEYLHDIENEYPKTSLSEIKSKISHRTTEELKKAKYGSNVKTLSESTSLDNWYSPLEAIKSTEDVRKIEKRFNVLDKSVEEDFRKCRSGLLELSGDFANFESNSTKAVALLKVFLQSFQICVDTLTMCTFLCVKFISNIHKNHARADIQYTGFNANEIDFESYKIKSVEPLRFSSLQSKLNFILPLFETLLTNDKFSYLTKIVASKTITNYDHIPFDLLTVQRLDTRFLSFLPVMSFRNMNNILQVVNDAKLYCLGKALTNSEHEFDELFNNVFNMMKHSLINGRDSDEIKAAAFIHVSAWSSALMSVKEYEKESTTNVAHCVQKIVPILKLGVKIFLKQTIEEEVAQIVCEVVEDALMNCIPQQLLNNMRKFLFQKNYIFLLKRSLIGQMLRSFCIQDDFEQFLSFVENYDHCSNRWILLFLVTTINDRNKSFIMKEKTNVIEENLFNVIQAVKQTTSYCKKTRKLNIFSWIEEFRKHFVHFDDNIFQYLNRDVKFNNVEAFSYLCCGKLRDIRYRLHDRIEIPEEGNVESTKTFLFSLPQNMCKELSNKVIGCLEQCPLCGSVCELDLDEHEYHTIMSHILVGIKGGRDRDSDELIALSCPSLVSNPNIFTSLDLADGEISNLLTFMENKHPTWDVKYGKKEPRIFWKYVFNRFNKHFADHYECREGKLPPDWKHYTREDAIRSLERTYNLEQSEITSHIYTDKTSNGLNIHS